MEPAASRAEVRGATAAIWYTVNVRASAVTRLRAWTPAGVRRGLAGATALCAAALSVCLLLPSLSAAAGSPETFKQAGSRAAGTLLHALYAGDGEWRLCVPDICGAADEDWGADSLTYALALDERSHPDGDLKAVLAALAKHALTYPAPCNGGGCTGWSDVPEWDTIALAREYQATHLPLALRKAELAFRFVSGSDVFRLGACPAIPFQQPSGGANRLKTLETSGNAIKAALLLFQLTHQTAYLSSAETLYSSVRQYFFEPASDLYTTYVFDDGKSCSQLPHRFFASVNGDMIWNGFELYRTTGLHAYLRQALATARAAASDLNDGRGVFADLQAENDVVEPLVEAMDVLASEAHVGFAREWILTNAAAAEGARTAQGLYGRFLDGPAPAATVTAWQTNGGLALEIAAAGLDPDALEAPPASWAGDTYVADPISGTPAEITFDGEGIALIGTLGKSCCESGHARLFIDGKETFDRTGIWQNKSSAGLSIPGTILFAWRWAHPGIHTLRFEAGIPNAKEGMSFLDLAGYYLVRG